MSDLVAELVAALREAREYVRILHVSQKRAGNPDSETSGGTLERIDAALDRAGRD